MSTATESATGTLVERFGLKALVECCLVLEEGIAGIKDIDIGMMAGAGILPGPFARADEQGLDDVLAALERAHSEWGANFEPPLPPHESDQLQEPPRDHVPLRRTARPAPRRRARGSTQRARRSTASARERS